MNPFEAMAAGIKRDMADRVAAKAAAENAERDAEAKQAEADRDLLEKHVSPLVREAVIGFNAAGVPLRIVAKDDRIAALGAPTIALHCRGPRTSLPRTGGTYEPAGLPISIEAADGVVTVEVGKHREERIPTVRVPGQPEDALKEALQRCAESYYAHVEEHRRFF
jgi:hypothetical protein